MKEIDKPQQINRFPQYSNSRISFLYSKCWIVGFSPSPEAVISVFAHILNTKKMMVKSWERFHFQFTLWEESGVTLVSREATSSITINELQQFSVDSHYKMSCDQISLFRFRGENNWMTKVKGMLRRGGYVECSLEDVSLEPHTPPQWAIVIHLCIFFPTRWYVIESSSYTNLRPVILRLTWCAYVCKPDESQTDGNGAI